jgi:hypothetical protein
LIFHSAALDFEKKQVARVRGFRCGSGVTFGIEAGLPKKAVFGENAEFKVYGSTSTH